jgi:hypothetical protein
MNEKSAFAGSLRYFGLGEMNYETAILTKELVSK